MTGTTSSKSQHGQEEDGRLTCKLNFRKLLEHKSAGRYAVVNAAMSITGQSGNDFSRSDTGDEDITGLPYVSAKDEESDDDEGFQVVIEPEPEEVGTEELGAKDVRKIVSIPTKKQQNRYMGVITPGFGPKEEVRRKVTKIMKQEESAHSVYLDSKLNHNRTRFQYPCTQCEKKFDCPSVLETHLNVHKDVLLYKCPMCTKTFKHKRNLSIHMIIHDEARVRKCSKCSYKCGSSAQLKQHMVIHQAVLYECTSCNKFFKSKVFFNHHMRLHSNKDICVCEICGMKFPLPSMLKTHMETHSQSCKYSCPECGNRYKQQRGLRRHLIEKHNEQTRSKHECRYCGKIWATPYTLHKHERTHKNNTGYKCQICGEILRFKSLYESHYRMHQGIKKVYGCDICGKLLANKESLAVHKKTHFEWKKVKCPCCDSFFKTRYTFNRHMTSRHPSYTRGAGQQGCKQCGKLLPVQIDRATCLTLHSSKCVRDLRVVIEKLQTSDFHSYNHPFTNAVKSPLVEDTSAENLATTNDPGYDGDDDDFYDGENDDCNDGDDVDEILVVVAPSSTNDPFTYNIEIIKQENGESDEFLSSLSKDCDITVIEQQASGNDLRDKAIGEVSYVYNTSNRGHSNQGHSNQGHLLVELEPSDVPVASNIELYSVNEMASLDDPPNVINIAPIEDDFKEFELHSYHSNGSGLNSGLLYDSETESAYTDEGPDTYETFESPCLLINGQNVKTDQKLAMEFPFVTIAHEHNYFEFSVQKWIVDNTCIHGNVLTNLDWLFKP